MKFAIGSSHIVNMSATNPVSQINVYGTKIVFTTRNRKIDNFLAAVISCYNTFIHIVCIAFCTF